MASLTDPEQQIIRERSFEDMKLLDDMLKAEVSMQDLITDIYAVNLAMYMDNHTFEMPEEFKEIGRRFLIDRNMSFMSQHMQEVWLNYQCAVKQLREQDASGIVPVPGQELNEAG